MLAVGIGCDQKQPLDSDMDCDYQMLRVEVDCQDYQEVPHKRSKRQPQMTTGFGYRLGENELDRRREAAAVVVIPFL